MSARRGMGFGAVAAPGVAGSGTRETDTELDSEPADGTVLDLADSPLGNVQPISDFAGRFAGI